MYPNISSCKHDQYLNTYDEWTVSADLQDIFQWLLFGLIKIVQFSNDFLWMIVNTYEWIFDIIIAVKTPNTL